jgi:transcriptional regulator with XRE-family HTH domain
LKDKRGLTQTSLAKASSISRPRINTILRGEHTEVQESTAKRLAGALDVSVDEIAIVNANSYREFIKELYETLDFRGCSLTQVCPLPLKSLFVPLRVRGEEPSWERNGDCEETRIKLFRDCHSEMTGSSFVSGLALDECVNRYDRVYLKGEPGSGKTTSLKHLAVQYAEGEFPETLGLSRNAIPLFVSLAEYEKAIEMESIASPLEFVAAQARQHDCEGVTAPLEDELRQGHCIVLLDGLDEVGATERVVKAILEFMDVFPQNKFVVTSRIIGSEEATWKDCGFAVLQVEELKDEDIQRFCVNWCSANHDHDPNKKCGECLRKADNLWQSIRSNSGVKEIATNPLMLTILAALDHATGPIPRRRVDLYSRIVDVRLETWDSAKYFARPGDSLHGILIEAKEFHWLLGAIGLEMQRKDVRLIPRWWLADFIQDYLHRSLGFMLEESKDQADRLIRHLCGRSGLLVERGPRLFGFSHLPFQEYFASRGIINESAGGSGHEVSGRLRPYLFHPRWGEVIRLVCAQLPPAQSASLIRVILDDPDPVGRFLRRGPLLALRCLSDGATVPDRDLITDHFDQLTALGESGWIGITIDVLRALRGLQGTRFEADARRTIETILGKALSRVSDYNYVALLRANHGSLDPLMPKDTRHWPGVEHKVKLPGRELKIICLGWQLEKGSPQKWHEEVFEIIRDQSRDSAIRCEFIAELARSVMSNEAVRAFLNSILSDDGDPNVRSTSALALRKAAVKFPSIRERILNQLRGPNVSADDLRCYGRALADSAPHDPGLRGLLLRLLEDEDESVEMRVAAAASLSLVTPSDNHVRQILAGLLASNRTPAQLRQEGATALEPAIGHDEKIKQLMIALLDESDHPMLARIANQAIAEALADGRIPWDARL